MSKKLQDDPEAQAFMAAFNRLKSVHAGDNVEAVEENPIQRQARLESLTSAIREQNSVMNFLVDSSPKSSSGYSKPDFVSNTPFVMAHLVLCELDMTSLGALAATCKQWHKRSRWFVETRTRTSMLLEFLHNERKYIGDLNFGLATFGRSMEKHSIVDKTVIFLNIPIIIRASRLLVSELYERIMHWSPDQLIGDVFVRLASLFDMYLFFAARLDSSLKLVKSLQNRKQAKELIAEISVRIGRDLPSFLTLPASHCVQMCTFLRKMIEYCPGEHPDVPHLQRAQEQMDAIVDELNKRHTVESVLISIQNLPPHLKETTVSVLREGAVTLENDTAGRMFLCSSCIILAIENEARELIFSSVLEFKPNPPVVLNNTGHEAAFDMQTSRGSTSVFLKNTEERISWTQSIKTALDAFLRKANTLNVFVARRDVPQASSRSSSLTVSKRSQVSLHGSGKISADLKNPKKLITLGRNGKNAFKALRGLHKRAPLVELAEGTALYQVFVTRMIHHDVHPVSLAADGAFMLQTPSQILCYCGPKLASDSAQFNACLALGSRLATSSAPMSIADPNDDAFWTPFGSKFKVTEGTHRDYIERYQAKFVVTVIHSDMHLSEEDPARLAEIMQQPCHFVLDVRDDVYVWVGHEAPLMNKTLAMAKAEEIFDEGIQLRPQCASVIQVEQGGQPNVIFDTLVELCNASLPPPKKKELEPPSISASADSALPSSSFSFKKRTPTNPVAVLSVSVPEIMAPVPAPETEKTPRQMAITQNKAKLDSVYSMLDSAEAVDSIMDQTEISYSSEECGAVVDDDMPPPPSKVPLSSGDADEAEEDPKSEELKSALAWIYDKTEEEAESVAVVEAVGVDEKSDSSNDEVIDILQAAMDSRDGEE